MVNHINYEGDFSMLNLIESCFQLMPFQPSDSYPPPHRGIGGAPRALAHKKFSNQKSCQLFWPKHQSKIQNGMNFHVLFFFVKVDLSGTFRLKLTNTTPLPVPAHQPGPPAARMACRKDLPGRGSGVQPPSAKRKPGTPGDP